MKTPDCIPPLVRAGISYDDAMTLRRIAMTLHRWSELECGSEDGAIERDEKTGVPYWCNSMTGKRSHRVPDRETAARKRLAKLMSNYPTLAYYLQGDPRGASVYILRPGDVPEGQRAESYYSRGLAVYR